MDTQTQIDRLIELAIIQRSELKQLVEQLPQLREHLNAEVEKVFDETEPQLRAELEEWTTKQTADKTAALGVALEAKIADLAKSLEVSTQARYNAIIAERAENARLAAQAEAKIAEHAASLPSAVKDIVTAELARFPRAGEIDQLRKEFAEPRGLNPRGKWQAGESYNKLDLVTINGDSYTSNTDGNRTRPSRSSADWTLVAARGTGGGGGPTSLSELTTVPSDGDVLIGSGTSWVTSNLTAGAGISITVGPGAITISATDGDITLDDGTAASPSLHFTNDPDTGIYRPAANTLGISTSGVQRMYVDENGITTVGAGGTFDGSVHAANGNANNPSFSFTSDQDTGFFRHAANEIGIALGGTQYATLTSTTFSITPVVTMASSLRVNGTTDSSSKDTGAIVTEGGLGVEKSATIGGNLTVSGTGGISISAASSGTFLGAITQNTSANGFGGFRATNDAGGSTRSTDFAVGGTTAGGNFSNYGYISAGSALSGFRIFSGGTTLAATFDSSGNTTLAGNLTVSGNGLNTFGGIGATNASILFGASNVANTSAGYLSISQRSNYGYALFGWNMTGTSGSDAYTSPKNATGSAGVELIGGSSGITRFIYSTAATTAGNALTVTEAARFSSGNLLLKSDGVDSGNGKLQLATHTTSAGGIGFGTDVSLYRSGADQLTSNSSGTANNFFLRHSTTSAGGFQVQIDSSKDVYLFQRENRPMYIGTNNTTALTLDSSQNATFAGRVAIGGAAAIGVAVSTGLGLNVNLNPGTLTYGAADAWLGARIRPARSGTTGNAFAISGQLEVVSGTQTKGATIMAEAPFGTITNHTYFYANSTGSRVAPNGNYSLYAESTAGPAYIGDTTASTSTTTGALQVAGGVGVAGAVNVGGAIAIGNTVQTAAAVASTHKVTISIGGSTYYLLATNV